MFLAWVCYFSKSQHHLSKTFLINNRFVSKVLAYGALVIDFTKKTIILYF